MSAIPDNTGEVFKVPFNIASESVDKSTEDSVLQKDDTKSETENSDYSNVIDKNNEKPRTNVVLPYKEPEWSGYPPDLFSFEIIKNGTFVETYHLRTSLTVFGRLDICNIVFEHPSVSRYHAIVQYCKGDADHLKGFYLYDLGSTHGTFLNKTKISPKVYYKLKVGYIIKFGGSTRLHIFQGPEEEESEEPEVKTKNEEECNWGMGEDASDDDDNLHENPFALSTPNEELHLEDPKKTLRGWFEREGYDLQYDVEEKGYATFTCRVQLPIDTASGDFMPVEATVSGKKKEAVIACALEACRTLDRLGLLRQSHQESRQRKKKMWEENDYYDSDEDTFLDRTGTIEKKREMRKRLEKKPQVETYQSLETKLNDVKKEISEILSKLSVSTVTVKEENKDGDSLENFMANLSDSNQHVDKIEQRKLRFRLAEVEKEKTRLEKLLAIARPSQLPPIVKHPGMIGKRIKSKLKLPIPKTEKVEQKKFNENTEEIEEDSSDESNVAAAKDIDISTADTKAESNSNSIVFSVNDDKEAKSSYGLKLKDDIQKENTEKLAVESQMSVSRILSEISLDKKRSIGPEKCSDLESIKEASVKVISPKRIKKDSSSRLDIDVYQSGNDQYATWLPPSSQTGDGMTHLNAKYGY